jgi:hypothetical protein
VSSKCMLYSSCQIVEVAVAKVQQAECGKAKEHKQPRGLGPLPAVLLDDGLACGHHE